MKKFSRKSFFKGLAIGTISLPFFIRGIGGKGIAQSNSSGPSIINGKRYQWKMVTTWPPNFPILGEGCLLFAEWVKAMSNGRMEIKVYGGGELVPPLECFDSVREGSAEIGHGAAYYWAGKLPAAQFFASIPFGMNAQQTNAWMISGGGLELWREIYADYNLVPMIGGNTGVQMGGWFNKEINSIEDFKGLKMRIPGLGGKVLQKAGGTAVLSPGSELYTNLERGIIDATEWIGPFHDYSMGFHEIAKYYYAPGWHEAGTNLEFFFNKEKYDELPDDLKVILQTAAQRAALYMLSVGEAKNAEYMEIIRNKTKAEVRQFSPDTLAALRKYNEEVIEEFVASDDLAKKVYRSFQSFQKRAAAWSELTEKIFYNDIQAS